MAGQLVATNSLGGSITDFGKLSAELYQQAYGKQIFRQFVDMKEGPGLRGGEMITFKKMLRIDTRGTRLNETGTIPKNLFKFVSGTATVSEWGKLNCSLARFLFQSIRNKSRQEKSGKFGENLFIKTMPSQANKGVGLLEGVETTRVSPNNNLLHEDPTRKGRHSPCYIAIYRSVA